MVVTRERRGTHGKVSTSDTLSTAVLNWTELACPLLCETRHWLPRVFCSVQLFKEYNTWCKLTVAVHLYADCNGMH
jgi:hypothetical protein